MLAPTRSVYSGLPLPPEGFSLRPHRNASASVNYTTHSAIVLRRRAPDLSVSTVQCYNRGMTPEQQRTAEEAIIRFQQENPDYWGDQDKNGIDLGHLRENLKLTPAERLRHHGIALMGLLEMEKARERNRTAPRPA